MLSGHNLKNIWNRKRCCLNPITVHIDDSLSSWKIFNFTSFCFSSGTFSSMSATTSPNLPLSVFWRRWGAFFAAVTCSVFTVASSLCFLLFFGPGIVVGMAAEECSTGVGKAGGFGRAVAQMELSSDVLDQEDDKDWGIITSCNPVASTATWKHKNEMN